MSRGLCELFNGLLVLSDHSMDCDVMWTMCGREGVFPRSQSVQREIKLRETTAAAKESERAVPT